MARLPDPLAAPDPRLGALPELMLRLHPADIAAFAQALVDANVVHTPTTEVAASQHAGGTDTFVGPYTATSDEVADALGYSRAWVYRNQHRLVSEQFGRRRLYDVAASRALYLSTQRQTRRGPTAPQPDGRAPSVARSAEAPTPSTGRRRVDASSL